MNPKDKALIHKNRLLVFDKENAKRTTVYDDQADYFSGAKDTWNDEGERNEAKLRDEKAQEEKHERKGVTLDLSKVL